MEIAKGLTFDDVLIVPKYSEIGTREEISLEQRLAGFDFKIPIISANMDYVTESQMAMAMWEEGGLGILHRFKSWPLIKEDIVGLFNQGYPVAFSVGIKEPFSTLTQVEWTDRFEQRYIVCIDVAHGHHTRVIDLIREIKKKSSFAFIVAGNVATAEGYSDLSGAGADAIKIGIGPGSVCTTRTVTGAGMPQLTAIMKAAETREKFGGPKIIADGGIKNSGDIVKALGAGADFVMLGHLLAGHTECPGDVVEGPTGRRYKPYRGQSIFGTNELRYTPEGISGYVEEKGPVAGTLKRLIGGIKSGFSYSGARNIQELHERAEFIEVSHGTHVETSTRVLETL